MPNMTVPGPNSNSALESSFASLSIESGDKHHHHYDEDQLLYSASESDSSSDDDVNDDDDDESHYEHSSTININKRNNNPKNVKNTDNDHTQITKSENGEILQKYSDKIRDDSQVKSARIEKDKSDRATVENAIDPKTFAQLNKFIKNGTLTKIDGCLSTGKEANIYYGINETTDKEYAIKVYKTSVLVFKDRERYINGEFRFKNFKNSNKINARKLIKVWSEKEFRNLKRLKLSGFNVPEPIDLKSNILLMEFLSATEEKGWPAPKLKDYEFADDEEVFKIYKLIVVSMRLMYQKCRLIHADLSEYNLIVNRGKIFIIDVSQSIDPSHPMALDFLRMDIKNISDYFSKKRKIATFMEKEVFKFITEDYKQVFNAYNNNKSLEIDEALQKYDENILVELVDNLKIKESEEDEKEDEIFRSLHLMRNLNDLEEEDFVKFREGKIDVFKSLVVEDGMQQSNEPAHDVQQLKSATNNDDNEEDENKEGEDGELGEDRSEEEEESEEGEYSDDDERFSKKEAKGKKYEDKEAKKLRKSQAKEQKQEKRKNKMKKHVKQKLIKKSSKK